MSKKRKLELTTIALINLITLTGGLYSLWRAWNCFNNGDKGGTIFFFLISLLLFAPTAHTLSQIICEKLGLKLGKAIYFPGDENLKQPPPEYSSIKSQIANGNIDDALCELHAIVKESPDNYYAVDLITNVLIEKKHDYKQVAIIIHKYLEIAPRKDIDADIVLRFADALSNLQFNDKLLSLLNEEVKCKAYSKASLKSLNQYLNAVSNNPT